VSVLFVAGKRPTAAEMSEATQTLIKGQRRTTNDTATSGTTEQVWATTPTLSLPASTTITLIAACYWLNSVSNDQFFMRLRQTNLAGTILNGVVAHVGLGGGPYTTWVSYTFETSTATSQVYVATIVRGVGTGTATVQLNSELGAFRRGNSGLFTTI